MTDRIETVKQITNEQLKVGGFAFALEGATPEESTAFQKLVEDVKNNGQNLVLTPNVKVIDLKAETPKTPEPVKEEVKTEVVPETKPVETPVVETAPVQVQAQPVPQQIQQPIYPQYVMGMPSWNQQVMQPMMPQVQPFMQPYIFPYSGIQPVVQQVPVQTPPTAVNTTPEKK